MSQQSRSAMDPLVAAAQRRGMSRRGFLRGASLSALALGSPSLLAACGTEGAQQTAESCVSKITCEKTQGTRTESYHVSRM